MSKRKPKKSKVFKSRLKAETQEERAARERNHTFWDKEEVDNSFWKSLAGKKK